MFWGAWLKILYTGRQKSGKSRLAEAKALSLVKSQKPYYVATSEAMDAEMIKLILIKIRSH